MGIRKFGVSLAGRSDCQCWPSGTGWACILLMRLGAGQLGCFIGEVVVPCLAAWPRFTCVAMLFPVSVITDMNKIIVKRIHLNKKLYILIKTCTSKNCACCHNNTDKVSK